jgi:hypothetical protein
LKMRSMDPFGKLAGEQHFAFCKFVRDVGMNAIVRLPCVDGDKVEPG